MSAIAGLVNLDGAPCEQSALDALARLLAHRSHDGTFTWREGEAGLLHGQLVTTPESAVEQQPLVDPATATAIVFDGRIDNRDDLLAALDVDRADCSAIGDAEVVLRTYRAAGAGCVDRLLGDFAFAIWDRRARRLFCARDHFGVKPFCYRQTAQRIAFASEPGALARYDAARPPINEGMVAEHLTGIVTSKSETLFAGIFRLPAAHTLVADANGLRLSRYWAPDLRAEIRLSGSDEYAERLRDLVERAVAVRLRVRGGVAVSLSGGVDSSSITGVAATLCARRGVAATGVSTFSLVGDGIDERAYSSQVVERWDLTATAVPVLPLPPGALAAEALLFADVPNSPNSAYTDRLRRCAHARGSRVLLNGGGGDDWFGVARSNYAELLRHRRLAALARHLRFDAAEQDFMGWAAAAKAALWPLVPEPAKQAVRRVLRRGRTPSWVNRSFATRVHLRDRLERHAIELPYISHERYGTWHQAFSGVAVDHYERFERSSARSGVDTWFPFFDRRVIEFGLGVPAAERWRDGRHKEILRRAMAPYLPAAVADRRSNPSGTHLLLDGIATEGGRAIFEDMTIAQFGWVNAPAILDRFDRAKALYAARDPRYHWLTITLWHVMAIELWARAMREELCLNSGKPPRRLNGRSEGS